ncbi:hypothetical protein [Streptosporangium lutulentum]|uniref:Mycothiol maleylpyruvate isomerase N-terminal domain-containing protein n=1 Tax=Streptosporangium lutulentum TaxID=1461250 RepID=A0ABT9QVG6_9ACTN|nr:hypothetical protein [Streptosporangium lutulentum]MDP9850401.1 hypothetical protein [Streptosporangium lutulentum]
MTRDERMRLAMMLAVQVDMTRHDPRLPDPLLSWSEGDVIAHLLEALAALVSNEPLGELAAEQAAELRTRIGILPGHDPERMATAMLDALGRRLGMETEGRGGTG